MFICSNTHSDFPNFPNFPKFQAPEMENWKKVEYPLNRVTKSLSINYTFAPYINQ